MRLEDQVAPLALSPFGRHAMRRIEDQPWGRCGQQARELAACRDSLYGRIGTTLEQEDRRR